MKVNYRDSKVAKGALDLTALGIMAGIIAFILWVNRAVPGHE